MPVAYEELEGSPRLSQNRTTQTGVRKFLVNWSDHVQFSLDLWGGWTVVGSSKILLPTARYPGLPHLWVSDVQVEPFGDKITANSQSLLSSDGPNSYEKALVTVKYEPIPGGSNDAGGKDSKPGDSGGTAPTAPEGTSLEFSCEDAVELITIPGRNLKWQADNKALGDDRPVTVEYGTENWTFSWSRVPSPPWTSIRIKRGAVNNATFCGEPEGHVLFIGTRAKRMYAPNASPLWSIDFRFKTRSEKWNKSFRQSTSSWETVVRDDGSALYAGADFLSLFALG